MEGTKFVGTSMSDTPNRVNRNGPLTVNQLKAMDQIAQIARSVVMFALCSCCIKNLIVCLEMHREVTKVPKHIATDVGAACLEIKSGG